MELRALTAAFVALCVLSKGDGAGPYFPRKAAISQAEDHANRLVKLLSNIKESLWIRNCFDLLTLGQRVSGLYTIFLSPDDDIGKDVYCDMDTDGGGWTVIQRRGQFANAARFFYKNWTEFANGFGHPGKEFWIGNHALHALTSGRENMALKVILTNHSGESVAVDYDRIEVAPEKQYFRLKLGSHLGPPGWDALQKHNSCSFTTFDQDHDNYYGNCASQYKGGWWYNACYDANPNGVNFNGPHEYSIGGIEWGTRGGSTGLLRYSYPEVEMMIRPK